MGPDLGGGRPCRLAESDTTLMPGSTNRPLVSPLAFCLLLSSCLCLSLARLFISIPHHRLLFLPLSSSTPSSPLARSSSLPNRYSDLRRLCSTLAEFHLSSITRRRLSRHCCEQIGRFVVRLHSFSIEYVANGWTLESSDGLKNFRSERTTT